jgi:TPR repeat protein
VRKNRSALSCLPLHLGLVAALASLAAAPALAEVKAGDVKSGGVKAGVEAWSAGNYAAAVQQWRPLADKGDADAQFNLAQAYKMGRGVPEDLGKAEELYGKAAAQGHVQASDTYGLMLFQRGERQKAMPYLRSSAARGDARAEYILGVAHFNGDIVEKDWVRAYALVSMAQRAGLPQAANALAQMDEHIPLADRQKSVGLAAQLTAQADATRTRETAGAELGTGPRAPTPTRIANAPDSPARAGADYTLPAIARPADRAPLPAAKAPPKVAAAQSVARPAPPPAPKPVGPKAAPRPAPAAASGGIWRLQLGAFGVPGNAEKLWASLSKRPEMTGSKRQLVPAGKLTKLYAAGFASKAQADRACGALKASGHECIVTS